jgi:hypothetical protein
MFLHRIAPRGKTRFPTVNLLATTDERDDNSPAFMAPHHLKNHLRF